VTARFAAARAQQDAAETKRAERKARADAARALIVAAVPDADEVFLAKTFARCGHDANKTVDDVLGTNYPLRGGGWKLGKPPRRDQGRVESDQDDDESESELEVVPAKKRKPAAAKKKKKDDVGAQKGKGKKRVRPQSDESEVDQLASDESDDAAARSGDDGADDEDAIVYTKDDALEEEVYWLDPAQHKAGGDSYRKAACVLLSLSSSPCPSLLPSVSLALSAARTDHTERALTLGPPLLRLARPQAQAALPRLRDGDAGPDPQAVRQVPPAVCADVDGAVPQEEGRRPRRAARHGARLGVHPPAQRHRQEARSGSDEQVPRPRDRVARQVRRRRRVQAQDGARRARPRPGRASLLPLSLSLSLFASTSPRPPRHLADSCHLPLSRPQNDSDEPRQKKKESKEQRRARTSAASGSGSGSGHKAKVQLKPKASTSSSSGKRRQKKKQRADSDDGDDDDEDEDELDAAARRAECLGSDDGGDERNSAGWGPEGEAGTFNKRRRNGGVYGRRFGGGRAGASGAYGVKEEEVEPFSGAGFRLGD